MNSLVKKFLILFFILPLLFVFNMAKAQDGFRGVENTSSNVDAPWEYEDSSLPSSTTVNNAIHDGNQKLYGVVGKTQILNFDTPVKRISIADPNLADIIILSSKQLMVNGKKAGSTSLIFWGADETPVFYNLVIRQDADECLKAVDYIAPNENI